MSSYASRGQVDAEAGARGLGLDVWLRDFGVQKELKVKVDGPWASMPAGR